MTDTAVTVGEHQLIPDSLEPVLPTLPSASPAPVLPASPSAMPVVPDAPASPSAMPVVPDAPTAVALHDAGDPMPVLPSLPQPSLPLLPASGPIGSSPVEIPDQLVAEVVAGAPEKRNHPMAHMMPDKPKPNEASIRAAEQRAARKTRARRIKVVVAVVAIAVAAVAGPPLVSWLVTSVNEAGSTPANETDEPVEQSLDELLEDDGSNGVPAAGINAIDDAKQLVGDTTP